MDTIRQHLPTDHPILAGGTFLVGLFDRYENKTQVVEPKVSWLVQGEQKANELLQFVQAWARGPAADYGDLFAAKIWLPSWVSPSATALGQVRQELQAYLEEIA